jgi:hypothetical protein
VTEYESRSRVVVANVSTQELSAVSGIEEIELAVDPLADESEPQLRVDRNVEVSILSNTTSASVLNTHHARHKRWLSTEVKLTYRILATIGMVADIQFLRL